MGADFANTNGFTLNKIDDSTVRATLNGRTQLNDQLSINGWAATRSSRWAAPGPRTSTSGPRTG